MKCDFCDTKNPEFWFTAKPFVVLMQNKKGDTASMSSDERWAACGTCADYIEADKLDELAELALNTFEKLDLYAKLNTSQRAELKSILTTSYATLDITSRKVIEKANEKKTASV